MIVVTYICVIHLCFSLSLSKILKKKEPVGLTQETPRLAQNYLRVKRAYVHLSAVSLFVNAMSSLLLYYIGVTPRASVLRQFEMLVFAR